LADFSKEFNHGLQLVKMKRNGFVHELY